MTKARKAAIQTDGLVASLSHQIRAGVGIACESFASMIVIVPSHSISGTLRQNPYLNASMQPMIVYFGLLRAQSSPRPARWRIRCEAP